MAQITDVGLRQLIPWDRQRQQRRMMPALVSSEDDGYMTIDALVVGTDGSVTLKTSSGRLMERGSPLADTKLAASLATIASRTGRDPVNSTPIPDPARLD